MDLQFYGANCLSLTYKNVRLVFDDNLVSLGAKNILRPDDIAIFTGEHDKVSAARLVLDGPGEYEVSDVSIVGLATQAHMDEKGTKKATMFKVLAGDINVLITGHIYPEINERQMEQIGMVDVMIVPVGGNGYTVDPIGALKLIKDIEPKLVIPTHFADSALKFPVPQQDLATALKELSMEPKETVSKLKLKVGELGDTTQLIVLEKS